MRHGRVVLQGEISFRDPAVGPYRIQGHTLLDAHQIMYSCTHKYVPTAGSRNEISLRGFGRERHGAPAWRQFKVAYAIAMVSERAMAKESADDIFMNHLFARLEHLQGTAHGQYVRCDL